MAFRSFHEYLHQLKTTKPNTKCNNKVDIFPDSELDNNLIMTTSLLITCDDEQEYAWEAENLQEEITEQPLPADGECARICKEQIQFSTEI